MPNRSLIAGFAGALLLFASATTPTCHAQIDLDEDITVYSDMGARASLFDDNCGGDQADDANAGGNFDYLPETTLHATASVSCGGSSGRATIYNKMSLFSDFGIYTWKRSLRASTARDSGPFDRQVDHAQARASDPNFSIRANGQGTPYRVLEVWRDGYRDEAFSKETFGSESTFGFSSTVLSSNFWPTVRAEELGTRSVSSSSTYIAMYSFSEKFRGETEETPLGDIEDAIFPEEIGGGAKQELPRSHYVLSPVVADGYANSQFVYMGQRRESTKTVDSPVIGYRIEADHGSANANQFLSFTMPSALRNGDDEFELVVNGIGYFLSAGDTFDFTDISSEGVGSFDLLGIDASEQLPFNENLSFVFGASFRTPGIAEVRMTPFLSAVPEPASIPLLAFALTGLCARRHRGKRCKS